MWGTDNPLEVENEKAQAMALALVTPVRHSARCTHLQRCDLLSFAFGVNLGHAPKLVIGYFIQVSGCKRTCKGLSFHSAGALHSADFIDCAVVNGGQGLIICLLRQSQNKSDHKTGSICS
jgi:hypothetical protein